MDKDRENLERQAKAGDAKAQAELKKLRERLGEIPPSKEGVGPHTPPSYKARPRKTSRPSSEIRDIARGLVIGELFGAFVGSESFGHAFMVPWIFIEAEERKLLFKEYMVFAYASLSGAMPRAINGIPMFMGMTFINIDDTQRVWDQARIFEEMLFPERKEKHFNPIKIKETISNIARAFDIALEKMGKDEEASDE